MTRPPGTTATSCLRPLIEGVVDYAGLFPPAGLPMETVVKNYAGYLTIKQAWMLGRIIIPTSRLAEFDEQARPYLPTTGDAPPWRISALLPPVHVSGFSAGLQSLVTFNREHKREDNGLAVIDSIELKSPKIADIRETAAALVQMPQEFTAFLEIPHEEDPTDLIAEIAKSPGSLRAKIRCGGVTDDLIPSTEQVARFLCCCAEPGVGIKATAGLHHPLRGKYRLTYDDDSARGVMHGFVNLLVATVFAYVGQSRVETIESILLETNAAAFEFQPNRLTWNGESIDLDSSALKRLRTQHFASFGSCSFVEPTDELTEIPFANALSLGELRV